MALVAQRYVQDRRPPLRFNWFSLLAFFARACRAGVLAPWSIPRPSFSLPGVRSCHFPSPISAFPSGCLSKFPGPPLLVAGLKAVSLSTGEVPRSPASPFRLEPQSQKAVGPPSVAAPWLAAGSLISPLRPPRLVAIVVDPIAPLPPCGFPPLGLDQTYTRFEASFRVLPFSLLRSRPFMPNPPYVEQLLD